MKNLTLAFLLWIALLSSYCALGQIHIKDNQSFHIGIGNDGVEIETSRNLYIRAPAGTKSEWNWGIRLGFKL